MESLDLVRLIREAVLSKKGTDVVVIDVRGLSPITDYYVIASGATAPQLKAMSGAVAKGLKEAGEPPCRRSGEPDDGWIVLDCFDVVIHMFEQSLREYYAIEELWAGSPRLV
ncbi:MAG: ribosome silencing factor [bacterium]|jgi:ribosome-associated protein